MIQIAPSILSADFARLADDVAKVEAGGADFIHVDVMDGHFVPNLTIGPPVVRALARVAKRPLDVHLMIEAADRVISDYVDAGAARISVHVEACPHLHRTVNRIKDLGAVAGVAINPATPIETLQEILPEVGQVLVMTVNPGFGGQRFIASSIDKLSRLKRLIEDSGLHPDVEVDGGVAAENAGRLAAAGATILVAGNSIFGAIDPAAAVRELRKQALAGVA